jgi:hypothetical protein
MSEKSHRSIINEVALKMARLNGWRFADNYDFTRARETVQKTLSTQKYKEGYRAAGYCKMAEAAFEVITGDRPDYDGTEDGQ